MFTKKTQEILPFVVGRAITMAFESQVRFGQELLTVHDPECAQVYQVVFMEIVGFKVDEIYVIQWIKKH